MLETPRDTTRYSDVVFFSQTPDSFNAKTIGQQLSYSGVLETIQIRKVAFAVRMEHGEFSDRFHVIVKGCARGNVTPEQICEAAQLDEKMWLKGKTKVFLKNKFILLQIERMREQALLKHIMMLQKFGKGFVQRLRYERSLASICKVQTLVRVFLAKLRLSKLQVAEKERKKAAKAGTAAARVSDPAAKSRAFGTQLNLAKSGGFAANYPASFNPTPAGQAQIQGAERDPKDLSLTGTAATLLIKLIWRMSSHVCERLSGASLGWLQKESSRGMKAYSKKKRWFVLKDGKLCYYTDQTCMDMKGAILLDATCHACDLGMADKVGHNC